MSGDLDVGIARELEKVQPALYATLVQLVRASESKAKIMATVERVTRETLTANAIEATVDYLLRQEQRGTQ